MEVKVAVEVSAAVEVKAEDFQKPCKIRLLVLFLVGSIVDKRKG